MTIKRGFRVVWQDDSDEREVKAFTEAEAAEIAVEENFNDDPSEVVIRESPHIVTVHGGEKPVEFKVYVEESLMFTAYEKVEGNE